VEPPAGDVAASAMAQAHASTRARRTLGADGEEALVTGAAPPLDAPPHVGSVGKGAEERAEWTWQIELDICEHAVQY
jgi:hypothetical protein